MEDHPDLFRELNWKWAKFNHRYQGNYCESCLRGRYEEVQPEDCVKCGYPRCSHLGFKCVACDWDCCQQCKLGVHSDYRTLLKCKVCSADVCKPCLFKGRCPGCPPPVGGDMLCASYAQRGTPGLILPPEEEISSEDAELSEDDLPSI